MGKIKEQSSIKEHKLFMYIALGMSLMSIIIISNVFFKSDINNNYLKTTLGFIKLFNIIISILGVGSCLISYSRVRKDSIFIISLMYLGLCVGITFGHIDYLSFYYKELTISTYIVVSASMLRIFLLLVSVSKNSKLKKAITNNKILSILLVIVFTIILGFIERDFSITSFKYRDEFFIAYNAFLAIVYIISSIKLFIIGRRENEYIYVVLSASIFMLSIKAIYSINLLNIFSFYTNLISVSLTYIAFFIVIIGAIIEGYMYIYRTDILNNNLKLFFNLAENNKHSSMLIFNEKSELLYANQKARELYSIQDNEDLKNLELILKDNMNIVGKSEEILKSLDNKGFWRGIIENEINKTTVDCCVQLINTAKNKKEIAVTYMDISDEIKMELEVKKLKIYDKEKTEFIANISHELKTPLNLFYSSVQLLDRFLTKEDLDFRSMYKKYNKTLHVNCKRMMRLINNIMDLSKIDIGIMKANFKNYDIVSIVEDVTLSVVDYALLKSINIQFDTNEEEQVIKCDSSMIERVMLNLLSNAIKFSDKDTNIFVNMFITDDWIEIEIKDEGIGICKKKQDIIFDKFVQVDKSFTRRSEGSGIGLSIVKSIINLHDGSISVNSNLNEGSVFKILLPNKRIEDIDISIYDINKHNTELELSDIYEILP